MIKRIVFTTNAVGLDRAHAGGGCILPKDFSWPQNEDGENLLHLLTIPVDWLIESQEGWLSVFIPFNLQDSYLHWEELTAEGNNQSVVLFHNNSGEGRDEYSKSISPARHIYLDFLDEDDSARNFCSKIYGIPAWLQDIEALADHTCFFAVNGDDVDIAFCEEPGIFSGGVVYVFLRDEFQSSAKPSYQGKMAFQFT